MKAILRSVRIAPKKAGLIAKMLRGKTVQEALEILERTNKKAARFLENLLRSAMANAVHNDKQRTEDMMVKSLTVNKARSYERGYPIARGRRRVYRKFLSHIAVQLGYRESEENSAGEKAGKTASQRPGKEVQKSVPPAPKAKKVSRTKGKGSASRPGNRAGPGASSLKDAASLPPAGDSGSRRPAKGDPTQSAASASSS